MLLNRNTRVSRPATLTAALAAFASIVAAPALAVPTSVLGDQDPSVVSAFELDFLGVDFGDGQPSVRRGDITTTSLGYQVDAALAETRLVRYRQDVNALILPGGQSTGPITVSVVPGSSAPLAFSQVNADTIEFQTSELYSITFTEDLSAYGFPGGAVQLPGNSNGTINIATGAIDLTWEGDGFFLNPGDATQVIQFHYTCAVHTRIVDQIAQVDVLPGDLLNLYNRVSSTPLPVSVAANPGQDLSNVDPATIVVYRTDGFGADVQPTSILPGPGGELALSFARPAVNAGLQLDSLPRGTQVELQLTGRLLDGTPFTAGLDTLTITRNLRDGLTVQPGNPVN